MSVRVCGGMGMRGEHAVCMVGRDQCVCVFVKTIVCSCLPVSGQTECGTVVCLQDGR